MKTNIVYADNGNQRMESGDHSKNVASSKDQMSRTSHRIIFTSLLLIAFLSTDGIAYAQDMNLKSRDISLQLLNKRGRPKDKVYVFSLKTNEGGFTDKSGMYVFKDMTDNDTISTSIRGYGNFFIPVTGMDQIVVTVRSDSYSYIDLLGEERVIKMDKIEPSDLLDVQEMLKRKPYRSLVDLLQGRVAGLNVVSGPDGTKAYMRGVNSVNLKTEPLVVVDGVYTTLSEADRSVHVNNIISIEILKDGAGWGMEGSNGVIIVKTK